MLNFIDANISGPNDYRLPVANFSQNHMIDIGPTPVTSVNPGKFQFGTLDTTNTLDTLRVYNGTVLQYDRDLLAEQIQMLLEAQNALTAEQLSMLANISTERFIRQGAVDSMVMEDLDEVGIPSAQKVWVTGSEQGWPLRRKGIGLQWTTEYFRQLPMRIFANNLQALLTADSAAVAKEIRRAIFKATNTTFVDRFKDSYALPVKALVNADSFAIPPNPYGITFNNAAHTHYMYAGSGNGDTVTDAGNAVWSGSTAAQKAANLAAMLQNLREHYTSGNMVMLCSTTEAPFFTTNVTASIIPGFNKYEYTYILPGANRDSIDKGVGTYNPTDTYNRAIGIFDGVEVWVKPWMPAGYLFLYDVTKPKPVSIRVPDIAAVGQTPNGSLSLGAGDLRFVFERESFPLYAQAMVRDFGAAASSERQNGVVFYVGSTSAYVTPTGL